MIGKIEVGWKTPHEKRYHWTDFVFRLGDVQCANVFEDFIWLKFYNEENEVLIKYDQDIWNRLVKEIGEE